MFTELFGSSPFKGKICFCTILLIAFLSVSNCSDSGKDHLRIPAVHDDKNYLVDQYVGAEACAECHDQVHEKWEGSHHFHAMELPNEQTVRADFNGSTFENYGVTTKFFREEEKYLVETENEEGELETFEVAYTFGWEPLQQYLIKFPDGRLQVLPTCWDVEKKEWYHLYPDERIAPEDPLFWTRSLQNWDHMCADCHSTNLRKEFDFSTQAFSTKYSEINVACESCHGPGLDHVEHAKSGKAWVGLAHYALADVNSTNVAQIESCAKCHARRSIVHPNHHAGDRFLDHFLHEVTQPWSPEMQVPTYHVDGQIDDEVYVYGSYVQSKMYHQGVKCTDCHDAHTTKLHHYDNQLCTRCHVPDEKNPAGFDNPGHHFHEMGTQGANCVECHMPHKNYMVIDSRRDHSIRIPRPDLSAKFGQPNACTNCHSDKSFQWAAGAIDRIKGPDRSKEVRHPAAFHAYRTGSSEAEKLLLEASLDKMSPAFTQSGALLALRSFISKASNEEAIRQLESNQSIVRTAAISKLETLRDADRYRYLVPMLKDSVRAVRTEAARALASIPKKLYSVEDSQLFEQVFKELKARYESNLDRSESHLSLGILAENQQLPEQAEQHYRNAIIRDELFVPARLNLATLLSSQGRNEEAEKLLRESVRIQPTWGQIHYSLGLLLAEDRARLAEAIRSLERASGYLPQNSRVTYNLAIAYWQSNRVEEAVRSFEQSIRLQPDSPEYRQRISELLAQRGHWNDALPHIRRLVELVPTEPSFRTFLTQAEQRSSSSKK
ncbi:MAG: tetratricopeptide repeat protein [Opitutales bacterium]|nr:tetratricopeptide repeat protein [Opitutales bacterium]